MREIKFDFVYELIKEDKTKFYIHRKYTLDEIMSGLPQKISMIMTDYPEYVSCSLKAKRQYIGLTDNKLKEVYEGDIISYFDGHRGFTCEVEYENGCFFIGSMFSHDVSNHNIEIIGNIYENQELLKEI